MKGIGRGVGIACLIAVGFFASYVAYHYFALNLLFNATTRHLYQYREVVGRNNEVNLIPGLFSGGESKVQVGAELLGAGLDAWNTSYTTMPPGAESVEKFHLWAGGRSIVCGSELFVLVGYDENDLLTSATLSQGGACL
ncbi:hypothetical protein [Devosia epidermidihirudinis]|nr:hypothetical protein [Devosia epidermidihirudinis]